MTFFASSFAGLVLPLRSPQHPCRAVSRSLLPQAVATGPKRKDRPMDAEDSGADDSDAFQQLVALSRKQSVNRPQNVNCTTFMRMMLVETANA